MSLSGFVWKQENFYIRQNKTWNMDKYKVVIVDDDEVSLENLSFELRKDARFSLEGTARSTTRFAVFGCGDAGYDGAGFVAGDAR